MASTAPITREGHILLTDHIDALWSNTKGFYNSEFLPKLWAVDKAYYIYKEVRKRGKSDREADDACSASLQRDNITLPVAAADADTAASNLADIFLTGNPIFGVVAPPDQKEIIPVWEALFQYYSKVGKWVPSLYRCFMSGIKYNLPVIDIDWVLSYEFNPADSYTTVQRQANMSPVSKGYLSMHSPDPYNLIWDLQVPPSLVSSHGDCGGYNTIMTKVRLKELLTAISMDADRKQFSMNIKEALEDTSFPGNEYNWKPPISQFIHADREKHTNWIEWVFDQQHSSMEGGRSVRYRNTGDMFLVTKLYLKVIPDDFGIRINNHNTPRIYKCLIINKSKIVYLEPIYTPMNSLPFIVGDLQDDFFDYQSFSEVEKLLPYQDAATELVNTRLDSAARALSDRAIYDPEYFNEGDVNTTEAAAKIPLKKSLRLEQKAIGQVYQPQPYDHSSTAGVMGDVDAILGFARMHSGRNEFMQGQSRKGNRTLGEFQQTMGAAQVRQMRIPLRIEHMIMNPLKDHTKSYIMQNLTSMSLVNTKIKKLMNIQPAILRDTLVEFKLTTGLVNKAMFVNPELLITGLQTIQANEELAMKFDVAEWFAYIMLMGGVPDVDQFIREMDPMAAGPAAPPGGPPVPAGPPTGS